MIETDRIGHRQTEHTKGSRKKSSFLSGPATYRKDMLRTQTDRILYGHGRTDQNTLLYGHIYTEYTRVRDRKNTFRTHKRKNMLRTQTERQKTLRTKTDRTHYRNGQTQHTTDTDTKNTL